MNKFLLFALLLSITTLLRGEGSPNGASNWKNNESSAFKGAGSKHVKMLLDDATNFVVVPKVKSATVTWNNPTTAFTNVIVVAKEGSGFTRTPTSPEYIYDPSFIGGGSIFDGGKVVYQGVGKSVNVTDLKPEKTYFFRIFVLVGTVWSAGVETSATIPALVIPNVINLTAVPKVRGATVSWTPPVSLPNVLVVAKEGSGFTTKPTRGEYIYDPSFIGGGDAFEGGKVVYQGTAKTLNISDLQPEKTYFVRVYVLDGTSWSLGTETSVTVPALVVPNVTLLKATAQSRSSVVSWTNPTSSFSNVLVVAKEGSGFTTKPTASEYIYDPSFIGGGDVFEGGKVVYQGELKTFNLTDLSPEKTYYIRVYVRDGLYWSTGSEVSITTPAAVIPNVTLLKATPKATSSVVNWTNPTSSFSNVLVVAKEDSSFTTKPTASEYIYDPSFIGGGDVFEGGKVVYQGELNTFNLTDLTPEKTYYIRVYVRDGLYWSTGSEISIKTLAVVVPNVTTLTTKAVATTATATWKNPVAFTDVLVVAKEGSSFTTKPIIDSYIYDPSFIGGGDDFEGGKVIYQGIDTTINITNLTPGQTYYVRVYVRSGRYWSSGTEKSVVVPQGTIPNVTAVVATVQTTSAKVQWKNPKTFTDVLVVAKQNDPFLTQPLLTTYTFNASMTGTGDAFEGGKVIYQGKDSTVNITNLTPGQTYYFRIYTRNGTSWSGGVQRSIVVPQSAIPNVTQLAATTTATSAATTWQNTIPFSDVLVVAKQGTGFTTKPTTTSYVFNASFTGNGAAFEGGKVVYQGTSTFVNITDLALGETYYIRVYLRQGDNWSDGVETVVTIDDPNLRNFKVEAKPDTTIATWKNPTAPFSHLIVVAKEGSGFTTIPTLSNYIYDPSFIGGGAIFEGGKVVYQGTEQSAKITDLTPLKTYFFHVYVYDGTSWSDGLETSTTVPEPVIPDVTLLKGTILPTSSVVSWTNPTPATAFNDVLVVVKEGSGFTTKPTDISYLFDPSFIGGGATFEGGKVAYQGIAKTVTVTNLLPAKTYFIRVFVRKGNAWSSGTETSVAIPAVVVPNVTSLKSTAKVGQVALSWTNPTTVFNNVLVVAKEGSPFTTKPTDLDYLQDSVFTGGGAAFEGGKVVYQGTGKNVTITGLQSNKTYYMRVYVRVGSDWSAGVETSVLVPSVVIANPTTFVVLPAAISASISWKNPSSISGVLVVAKQGTGFTTKPSDTTFVSDANFAGTGAAFEGGKVVYQGKGTKVTITNLTPGQTYFVRVYARKGSDWSSGVETSVVIPAPALNSTVANTDSNDKMGVQMANYDDNDAVQIKTKAVAETLSPVFNLFPNPAKERVTIDLSESAGKSVDIQIVNFFGGQVYREKMNVASSATHSIDVSNFVSGQYLVRITTDNKQETVKKLVIAH